MSFIDFEKIERDDFEIWVTCRYQKTKREEDSGTVYGSIKHNREPFNSSKLKVVKRTLHDCKMLQY